MSFRETVTYFSEKLRVTPAEEDVEKGSVELVLDGLHIAISKGALEGCLDMQITLGLMLQPIREGRLKELAASNFLGVNTGGCTLAFDEVAVALSLNTHTSCGTPPEENWEWLHRIVCVAREWNKFLGQWDEYVALTPPFKEVSDEHTHQTGIKS